MSKDGFDLAPSHPTPAAMDLRNLALRVGFMAVIALLAGFAARLLIGAPGL